MYPRSGSGADEGDGVGDQVSALGEDHLQATPGVGYWRESPRTQNIPPPTPPLCTKGVNEDGAHYYWGFGRRNPSPPSLFLDRPQMALGPVGKGYEVFAEYFVFVKCGVA